MFGNDPLAGAGAAMHALVRDLYPLCRSLTGPGVRATLRRLQDLVPLEIFEIPSGTPVFDWTVPDEWEIRDAWIADSRGERLVDFGRHNLHVVGYSPPVRARLTLAELAPHLHSLPGHPDWIPYRTSYFAPQWGFCLSQRQREALCEDEVYEVVIDSTLAPGALTYGECALPGEQPAEVLISTHVCHPSLCNDNLSGVAVAAYLAAHLAQGPRRLTYRFLFIPGTLGSIAWLAQNEARAERIAAGLVLAGVGDAGPSTYKQSRRGDALIDRAMAHVLKHSGQAYAVQPFSPYGYDERQYCSPGFDLPVGALMRTPFGQYPEYHTSADDPDFVKAEALADSLAKCLAACQVLEHDRYCLNLNPRCEPQLGKRGLYGPLGGQSDTKLSQLVRLWVLNFSDGQHSLLDIAERADLPFTLARTAADELEAAGLLRTLAYGAGPAADDRITR